MFRYIGLMVALFTTGCASMQDTFCNLIESDSYVLASLARCQTMHVSFDYDNQTDFSALESYQWIPSGQLQSRDSDRQDDSRLHEWITDAVDAQLAAKGFSLGRKAPDFLVSYDVPVAMLGSLTLTFVHPENRQPIWRGESSDEAYAARNQAAWETRVRAAVGMLLAQFPPPDDQ